MQHVDETEEYIPVSNGFQIDKKQQGTLFHMTQENYLRKINKYSSECSLHRMRISFLSIVTNGNTTQQIIHTVIIRK